MQVVFFFNSIIIVWLTSANNFSRVKSVFTSKIVVVLASANMAEISVLIKVAFRCPKRA